MDEFEGYAVFEFPHTQKMIMKCPIAGNAIYVTDKDWQNRAWQQLASMTMLATEAGDA